MSDAVRCPACDAPLSADRVDFRRGLTACDHCGVVSKLDDFAADLPPDGGEAATDRAAEAPPVTRPAGWTVEERGGVVAVRWRWWNLKYVPLAFFCVAWDGFLIFWYAAALGFGGGGPDDGIELVMVVFPIVHVAIGVGLTYSVLCGFLNRTSVTAGAGRVRVRHEPLPWRGSDTHDARDFARLFFRDRVSRETNSTTTTHDVSAATRDGGEVTLLRGLDKPNEARFLAAAVGRALGVSVS